MKRSHVCMFSRSNINAVLELFRNNNKMRTNMRRLFEENVIFSSPKYGRHEFVSSLTSQTMLLLHRTEFIKPFLAVGVDFAGAILYKRTAKKTGKADIALFTCSSTRAVHLKLTPNLSAPEFIKTLKEFVARRGTPKLIISDNAVILLQLKNG